MAASAVVKPPPFGNWFVMFGAVWGALSIWDSRDKAPKITSGLDQDRLGP